jgi:hypothetical protein
LILYLRALGLKALCEWLVVVVVGECLALSVVGRSSSDTHHDDDDDYYYYFYSDCLIIAPFCDLSAATVRGGKIEKARLERVIEVTVSSSIVRVTGKQKQKTY